MFTGLVQDVGTIVRADSRGGNVRLVIEPDELDPATFERGESIASNGVCLTVVALGKKHYEVDVGLETLQVTTAATWKVGDRVNLERSLALGDRLGGHLVQGHVDGQGKVLEAKKEAGVLHLDIAMPEALAPLICEKGSIAVDGVSLTVNVATKEHFRVTLIPETVERTTLGARKKGDAVNLEADIIARQIARMLAFGVGVGEQKGGLDLAFLAEHGYGGG
ncbi:MAG: riboflavin synthase [Deltaproteobacteria bacterium]|nr:riboflavin synthase [Deltaproteobacteria bacterium]